MLFAQGGRGLQVVSCSTLASTWKIAPGMPLADARGLSQGPENDVTSRESLIIEPDDPQQDRRQLEYLAQTCQAYAPLVGLEEGEAPQSLLLEITGCAPHFQGEESLARQLQNELQQAAYHSRVAIADTVGAAWAMAHYGTTMAKSIRIVPAELHREALRTLSIGALRLSPKVLEILNKLDVRTVQQLERLPRTSLPSRFGTDLQQRLDQAWGVAHEPIIPVRPRQPITVLWNFETPITDLRALDLVTQELLDRTLLELQPLRAGILELRSDYCGPVDTFEITLRLVQPSAERRHLWGLFQLEWERQQRGFEKSRGAPQCLTEGVTAVQLVVLQSAPLRVRQQTLFEIEAGQRERQTFHQLIERLGSRLGKPAVLRSQRISDPQPEFSCEFIEWPVTQTATTEIPRGEWDAMLDRSRPLRLLPCPEPLQVIAVWPDGPPQQVQWNNNALRITRAWGPERIETGWWREHGVQRDYYRIETQQGPQFWIFRCLFTGKWYLHGSYE